MGALHQTAQQVGPLFDVGPREAVAGERELSAVPSRGVNDGRNASLNERLLRRL